MNLSEILQWTGEPGTAGCLVVVAWQLGRLVRRFDLLERRVTNVETQAHVTANELANVRRMRGQRHA